MLLLSVPFEPGHAPAAPLPWRAVAEIAGAAAVLVVAGLGLARGVTALEPFGRAVAAAGSHAALVGCGWVIAVGAGPGWRGPVGRLTVALLAISLIGRIGPWGAVAYLAFPLFGWLEARRRPELAGAGLSLPGAQAALLGLAAGIFLGLHLLMTASLTFGYTVRLGPVSQYVAAAAYDVGLSAITAEWLFRGALFPRAWRRWALAPAVVLTSALAVTRYLADPNLPWATEAWLGAALYMGLLSVAACVLRAQSGSLLPGYLAAVGFFLAYRCLAH
jgi:CAAX prenyl protease-like protein